MKVLTILDQTTDITDAVTMTTDRTYNYHAYIVPVRSVHLSESNGAMVTELPRNSNIAVVEDEINRLHRHMNGDVFSGRHDGANEKIWTDGFGRITASKFEHDDGITFKVRGDMMSRIIHERGKVPIQCNKAMCNVLIPNKLSVNFTDFTFQKPTIPTNGGVK
jgi:hypothetical protein